MSFSEILKLLKIYVVRIIVVAIACALIGFAGAKVVAKFNPSYTATSTVVTAGGTFATATGIANSAATQASQSGVVVTATSTTTNYTITFTAKGKTKSGVINAANGAANTFSDNAKSQEAVKNTTVTLSDSAKSTHKSATFYALAGFVVGLFIMVAFYLLRASIKRAIYSPEAVSSSGLPFLGCIKGDASSARIAVANFQFSGKDENNFSRKVLLHPTNSSVNVAGVRRVLTDQATQAGMILREAPALKDSVFTLYEGKKADAVIVVVEEGTSTLTEIEEVIREFSIADVPVGGFVYVPQNKAKKSKSKSQKTISTTPKRARHTS